VCVVGLPISFWCPAGWLIRPVLTDYDAAAVRRASSVQLRRRAGAGCRVSARRARQPPRRHRRRQVPRVVADVSSDVRRRSLDRAAGRLPLRRRRRRQHRSAARSAITTTFLPHDEPSVLPVPHWAGSGGSGHRPLQIVARPRPYLAGLQIVAKPPPKFCRTLDF